MSYICVIGNENGIVAGSDSRETIAPNKFLDNRQKVFVDKKQNLIWACCGITKYNGIDYIDVVERILRDTNLSFIEKIDRLQIMIERVTKECYNYIGNGSAMDILIGYKLKRKILIRMNIQNGEVKRNTFFAPLAIEGGSGKMIMNKLPLKDYNHLSLKELEVYVKSRVQETIDKDKEISINDPTHVNTIGGKVRTVAL